MDDSVAYLDRHGIDRSVFTLARPTGWRGLDPDDTLDVARLVNDETRLIADEHPDRSSRWGGFRS